MLYFDSITDSDVSKGNTRLWFKRDIYVVRKVWPVVTSLDMQGTEKGKVYEEKIIGES